MILTRNISMLTRIIHCLKLAGHSWKQGQWSREEVDILSANIAQYCKVI